MGSDVQRGAHGDRRSRRPSRTPEEFGGTERFQVIRRLGDATPYELSGELFPHIKDFSIMLGVSEVVGHLDLLEDEGKLLRSNDHPHRYAAA